MVLQHNNSDSLPRGIADARPTFRMEVEPNERGVALVITLLLLFLMSVIGLAAVLSASSDLLINGYYSNYRGSFYAGDSGLNVARQQLTSQVIAAVPTTYTSPPMPSTVLTTAPASVMASYGNPYTINAGQALKSWQGSFKITTATLTPTACTETGAASPTVVAAPGCPTNASDATAWQYTYGYTLTSVGRATGYEQATVTENGSIILNVTGTPASGSTSFAYYGAFITNYPPCLGALIPGTMTGPMFTDGAWGFEPGTYIFTDPVGQADPDASFFINGCNNEAASSYSASGQTVAPQFQDGFNLNQPAIAQPSNSYSQKWAAVDGKGVGEADTSPTNADLHANLKNVAGAAYPTSGASTGVYLNYQSVSGVNTMQGGGLYVEGNANITLSTIGASAQVITIKQGSTITTMTVDPLANSGLGSTVVTSGSNTLTLVGIPTNSSVTPPQPGTMLYVDGTITALTGPGQGVPAIQDGAALTITALNDIDITGDVVYKTEPVTVTQNQIPSTPIDTLIPGNDKNQDLGIFTANGNIVLSSPYSNNNLQVDGSQAAIGASCASNSCGFLVNGFINTFNNVGGQIQTNIFSANMNTENTYYDRRYSSRKNFAPPWFPSTNIISTPASASAPLITIQRTQWVANAGQ